MFKPILDLIEENDSIIINGHLNPDGDCYGSQIALKEVLHLTYPNKKIYIVGSGLPKFFTLLGKMDDVPDDVFRNSLIVVLDGNDLNRMEDKRVFTGKAFARIDHHIEQNSFSQGPQVVDENASSTCELVVDFIKECGLKMSSRAANALFLGLLTDSGRFQFAQRFTKLFSHAHWLCLQGATPKDIYSILNTKDEVSFKLRSLFYSRYQITNEGTVFVVFRYEDYKEFNISSIELANMVNFIGHIENCPIWIAFVEGKDGRVKVEIRSDGPSVQPITIRYGGGGHRNAAGMSLTTYDEKLIQQIINECDDKIKDYKEGRYGMWEKELQAAIEAGLLAKSKILDVYNTAFEVEIKEDNSPVTLADKQADVIIREHLQKLFPTHAFLTEESEDNKDRLNNDYVWIIDPLDGTKDFVGRDNQFTTNIALAYKHKVVVGVVVVPVTGEIYYASKDGGAYHRVNGVDQKIHVSDKLDDLTCLTSVYHFADSEKELIQKHSDRIKHVMRRGSSLKPCSIAEGVAEITYRLSRGTKEWDTAASQIIVEEAGGLFVKLNGEPLTYNREDVYNDFYIIVNRKENILL